MRSLLFLAVFLVASPAALALDCSPNGHQMKDRSGGDVDSNPCQVTYAKVSQACQDFTQITSHAVQKYRADMAEFCRFVKDSATNACRDRQRCQQVDTAKLTGGAADRLQNLIRALEGYRAEVDKAKEKLMDELEEHEKKACESEGTCKLAYRNMGDPNTERPRRAEQERNKLRDRIQGTIGKESPSTITGAPRNNSRVLGDLEDIANSMSSFQKEVSSDISKLRPRAQQLRQQQRTANERAQGLDNNKSDITGGQPQQQAGGSPGGGSPGGGSPAGGSPSASPSSITDPTNPGGTSPTPGSLNEGTQFADDSEKDKKGPSTLGPNGPGLGDLTPGKGGKPGTTVAAGPGALPVTGTSYSPEGSDAYRLNQTRNAGAAKVGLPGSGGSLADGSGASSTGPGGGDSAKGGAAAVDSGGAYSGGGGDGGGGGGGGGGADEVLSPFGQPLGDPKIALAGSETDASVKNLVDGFDPGGEAGSEGSRELASEGEDGIGERNGPSLFDRARAFYDRCARNACVSAFRRKTSGG